MGDRRRAEINNVCADIEQLFYLPARLVDELAGYAHRYLAIARGKIRFAEQTALSRQRIADSAAVIFLILVGGTDFCR